MATTNQKKKWFIVGLLMILGAILGMYGVIREADLSDAKVAVYCIAGFGTFIAGVVSLLR